MNLKYNSRSTTPSSLNRNREKQLEVRKVAKLVAEDVKKILSSVQLKNASPKKK